MQQLYFWLKTKNLLILRNMFENTNVSAIKLLAFFGQSKKKKSRNSDCSFYALN